MSTVRVHVVPHTVLVVVDGFVAATFVYERSSGYRDGEEVFTPVLDKRVAIDQAEALAEILLQQVTP